MFCWHPRTLGLSVVDYFKMRCSFRDKLTWRLRFNANLIHTGLELLKRQWKWSKISAVRRTRHARVRLMVLKVWKLFWSTGNAFWCAWMRAAESNRAHQIMWHQTIAKDEKCRLRVEAKSATTNMAREMKHLLGVLTWIRNPIPPLRFHFHQRKVGVVFNHLFVIAYRR